MPDSYKGTKLRLEVLDAQNNILWKSGGTNADGVTTDSAAAPRTPVARTPPDWSGSPTSWT
jgi:hypothetical protein